MLSDPAAGQPLALLLYYRGDRDMFMAVYRRLAFLNHSGVVRLQPWYLTDIHSPGEADRTAEMIRGAQVVLVFVSPALQTMNTYRQVVLPALFGENARLLKSVRPVVLASLFNRDFDRFRRDFQRIWDSVYPEDHQALWQSRQDEAFENRVICLAAHLADDLEQWIARSDGFLERFPVYLSYSRKDFYTALLMRFRLQRMGLQVWMDPPELRGRENWRERVRKQILESSALVVLLSEAACRSAYVEYEWIYANGADIGVIPVMIEHVENLHPGLPRDDILVWYYFQPEEYPWDELEIALLNALQ
ncbi:MAG: toll/interleukin-1 receptor domain-containing protein [Anaerolineae bacterium]|nr:MAG: toll/interleukin-1 receptor domain-containing protein [Anaerolineae bacterium]